MLGRLLTYPLLPYVEWSSESLLSYSLLWGASFQYSPSTSSGGLTAPLVWIPDTEAPPSAGCTPGDYAGVDATGKIALIQRGGCAFADKATNAKAAGAVGAVGRGLFIYLIQPLRLKIVSVSLQQC